MIEKPKRPKQPSIQERQPPRTLEELVNRYDLDNTKIYDYLDRFVDDYNANQKILWQGGHYMNQVQTAVLSENISDQNNGIILAWSAYSNGSVQNYNWNFTFVPKQWLFQNGTAGVTCMMTGTGFDVIGCKYVYIHNDKIVGNASNNQTGTTNGITWANNAFVLRYVIGV